MTFFNSIGPRYILEEGAINKFDLILKQNNINYSVCLVFVDSYFKKLKIPFSKNKFLIEYYNTKAEPDTNYLDKVIKKYKNKRKYKKIDLVVGYGGGSVLDVTKAFSIGYCHNKSIENFQGWNPKINKTIKKIGIPSISGTGAESTKTCVLINKERNIKLGINSLKSIFDFVILDPNLIKSVPKKQYFFTAMDSFIHSFETLEGNHRNLMSDFYSTKVINIIDKIFSSKNIKSKENRMKLMIASYLGGLAISNSYVGLVHPVSAGLSTVFGIKHCEANCIVLKKLKKYYPKYHKLFSKYLKINNITINPLNNNLNYKTMKELKDSTLIHSKPLINALGKNYKKKLANNSLENIFKSMF